MKAIAIAMAAAATLLPIKPENRAACLNVGRFCGHVAMCRDAGVPLRTLLKALPQEGERSLAVAIYKLHITPPEAAAMCYQLCLIELGMEDL